MLGFGGETSRIATEEEVSTQLANVTPEDLQGFGLIPEFIGRLPVIASLRDLNREELIHVLTEPKNSLSKQFSKLLAMDGVELQVTEAGFAALAEEAIKRGPGARALRSIFEKLMLEIMFQSPDSKTPSLVKVDRAVVMGETEPKIVEKKK